MRLFMPMLLLVARRLCILADPYIKDKLVKHLLKSYVPTVRPVKDPSEPLDLAFNIKLLKIVKLDAQHQKITLQVNYEAKWTNELLTWDSSDWKGTEILRVKSNLVWTPDITLMNNADDKNAEPHKGTDYVYLQSNGVCIWIPQLTLKSFFRVDVKYFPFDIQTFSLKFRSWSMPEDELRLQTINQMDVTDEETMSMAVVDGSYINSSEWKILKTEKNVSKFQYRKIPGKYTVPEFKFVLLRKSRYYIITAIIPVVILIVIALFSYFLPANSGERMGVLITVLLAFTVYLQLVTESLPTNSDATSILSIFYLVSMSLCTLSFLGTCLVISLIQKGERGVTIPPRWARKCFLRNTSLKYKGKKDFPSSILPSPSVGAKIFQNSCDKIRNDERNASFSSESEVYVAPATSIMTSDYNTGKKVSSASINHRNLSSTATMSEIRNMIIEGHNDTLTCLETMAKEMKDMREGIDKYLTVRCATINNDEKHDKIQAEWNGIAEVTDQILFWLFLGLVLVLSIVILVPAYLAHLQYH